MVRLTSVATFTIEFRREEALQRTLQDGPHRSTISRWHFAADPRETRNNIINRKLIQQRQDIEKAWRLNAGEKEKKTLRTVAIRRHTGEEIEENMAMVMDFLIGILLLLAAAINVLALGAFVITPSLRSTSNRFVINLLIVHVIGCLILAPSLLFNSNVIRNLYSEEEVPTEMSSTTELPLLGDTKFNRSSPPYQRVVVVEPGDNDDGTMMVTTSVVKDREINSTIYKVDNISRKLITDAAQEETTGNAQENTDTPFHSIRPWILDIVAAIGALSLVLVVGDTYCAVTDPLRYHSRISASRVCCLLIIIWGIAVSFGLGSALRSGCIEDILRQHSVYNTVFGSAYFICIILIPFSLVGAMYWGIIREARKNGLRLRHNGSSPLLQSVLHIGPSHHLHHHHHHHHHHGQCLSLTEEPPARDEEKCLSHQLLGPATKAIDKSMSSTRQTLRISTNLRRNKSAQHLMGPTCCACGCCEEILITRSISNQSASYLNSGATRHLKVSNRDLLRTARSSPDLHQTLLLSESGDGVVFEHIRMPISISVRPPTKTSLGYMTSIRHRLSNASSLFKYREESRAARISILVVIMFLVSYIPFGLLVLAEGHDSFLSTYQQTVLAIFFVVLANIISPLIFAYRNKRVRRGIQRLVSVPRRTGCGKKDRGKGDNINNNNNGSIREASERNTHQTNNPNKMSEHIRDQAEDTYTLGQQGRAGSPLFHETNGVEQRRKLVIFNGRNGQITKICHPEHHKNFVRLKKCGMMMKGCSNNDQLVVHNKSVCTGRNKNPFDVGCSASTLKLTAANQRVKVIKSARSSGREVRGEVDEEIVKEPFLRRIRTTSGQLFKKSTVRAMVPPPQVNIDFPSTIKPMDV